MQFVLLDQSTAATADDAHGGPLTPGLLQQIATALEVQLNRDLSPEWGGDYSVRAGSGPADVADGEIVCAIIDTTPEPDVVAYHTADGAAHPWVFAARDMATSILSGNQSLSFDLSHELCETPPDADCNVWCDDGNGSEHALEVCDPTEQNFYSVNGVSVSNFALRAFFQQGAPGPWTYLGSLGEETVPGPFGNAPGGYQGVRATDEGGETDIFGEMSPRKNAKRRHPSSRTYRRGVRLSES